MKGVPVPRVERAVRPRHWLRDQVAVAVGAAFGSHAVDENDDEDEGKEARPHGAPGAKVTLRLHLGAPGAGRGLA